MVKQILSLAFFSALASALTVPGLDKRVTTTGNPRIDFKCDSLTLPQPGTGNQGGSSGSGYFDSNLIMTNPDGTTVSAAGCAQDTCAGTCLINCQFDSPFLPAGTLTGVSVSFSPIGGTCSMNFNYNGIDYDSGSSAPNGQCGETSDFAPFSDTQTAECYI